MQLFAHLLLRDLSRSLKGTISGWLWFVATPLLLLGVYWFVFGVVFSARAPENLDVPFAAWLAVALWPWLAFSDGVLRGSQAIPQSAALLSKVSLPRVLIVASKQTAAFILQVFGFAVVLVALVLIGVDFNIASLFYLAILLFSLYLFSLGLAIFLSTIQVFFRDIDQFLPTMFMLWFFTTPILYSPAMLPKQAASLLQFNPMTWWVSEVRMVLFQEKVFPGSVFLVLLAFSLAVLWVSKLIFDRSSPHFEDFL